MLKGVINDYNFLSIKKHLIIIFRYNNDRWFFIIGVKREELLRAPLSNNPLTKKRSRTRDTAIILNILYY